MSKKELLAGVASATALVATAASAADLAAVANDEATASAGDWSGFYAGISASAFMGDLPIIYVDSYEYVLASGTVGAFAGFREDNGSGLVWGAELAYSSAVQGANAAGYDGDVEDYGLSSTLDAKVTLGMPVANALVYGFAGASVQDGYWGNNESDYISIGMNLGAGVEYKLTDKIALGLEYTQRFMMGPDMEEDTNTYQSTNSSLALRVSYSF